MGGKNSVSVKELKELLPAQQKKVICASCKLIVYSVFHYLL